MPTDREIAARVKDMQDRARTFRMHELPGYSAWSQRKLDEGEDFDAIMNLDDVTVWVLPEEAERMGDADYDEMLDEYKDSPDG